MSTLKLDTIASRDGTESTDVTNVINGSAKAWVNFNGTGTVAIRKSFNVSSITDNGTGDYTVTFTNAMPDVNYSVVAQSTATGKGYIINFPKNASSGNITTTSVVGITADFNGNTSDNAYVFVAIHR